MKTLAAETGVTRTAFYPEKNRDGTTRPGPYQHLAEEFERGLRTLQEAGDVVDPRFAQIEQIERLKAKVAELKERLTQRDETVAELTTFKELAVSRLAAQHDEIVRLQEQASTGTGRSPRQRPPPARRPPRNSPVRILQLSLASTEGPDTARNPVDVTYCSPSPAVFESAQDG